MPALEHLFLVFRKLMNISLSFFHAYTSPMYEVHTWQKGWIILKRLWYFWCLYFIADGVFRSKIHQTFGLVLDSIQKPKPKLKPIFFGFKTKNQTKKPKIFGYYSFKNKKIVTVLINSNTENLKIEVTWVKNRSLRLSEIKNL